MSVPRPLARLGGVIAAAVLACAFWAAPAYAHATVVSTTPQNNSVVDTQPAEVTVEFTEAVSPVAAQTWIVSPDGSRANASDAVATGSTLTYPLREGLPDGTYFVGYRVISADGHPVTGGFTFSIGAPSASPPSADSLRGPTVDPVVDTAVKVNRFLATAGLALALGPALLLVTRRPGPRKGVLRLTASGMSVVALTAVTGLYLQAPYTTGASMFGVTGADVSAVVDSRYGTAHLLRLFAVLAALPVLLWSVRRTTARRHDRWILAVLAVACVATWPLAGHATTSPAPWLTVATDTVHVLAGAVWLGGLVTLAVYLLRPALTEEAGEFLPVWSAWAMRAVVALAIAGAAQALVEIGEPAALFATAYGKLVLTKIALFGVLLVAAGYARRLVRERADGEDDGEPDEPPPSPSSLTEPARRGIRGAIGVEIVIAVVILAVTAVLVQTTPARVAYAEQERTGAEQYSTRLTTQYYQLQVELDPGRTGNNSLHLYAFTPDGAAALDVMEWKVTVSLPAQNVAPIQLELVSLSPDHVTAEVALPYPGDWDFRFTLRVSRLDQVSVTQTVPIQ